jgi:glutamyl-Q tRNA(Asp) synthetase
VTGAWAIAWRTASSRASRSRSRRAGSLATALASWLDVRARGPAARWLVRIEDADTERCLPGLDAHILRQLADCALLPDDPPVWQTARLERYERALDRLVADARAYPCACSRKDIDAALARQGVPHSRHGERVYPGTCRCGLRGRPARAWRFAVQPLQAPAGDAGHVCDSGDAGDAGAADDSSRSRDSDALRAINWSDRRLGPQRQDVAGEVGDFVLRRADGPWAYQLAVVVDDAEQGITDIVRGEDLADNTARQILLQQALALPTPTYLHTPLVLAADGQKLSKQNGARAVDTATPRGALAALDAAARVLGLAPASASGATADALAAWVLQWRDLYNPRP